MRYTKLALLAFGAGLVFALVVVAGELQSLERLASAAMALPIAALPVAMLADWRRAAKAAQGPAKKHLARRKTPVRRARRRRREPRVRRMAGSASRGPRALARIGAARGGSGGIDG